MEQAIEQTTHILHFWVVMSLPEIVELAASLAFDAWSALAGRPRFFTAGFLLSSLPDATNLGSAHVQIVGHYNLLLSD